MLTSGFHGVHYGLALVVIFQLIRLCHADHDDSACPWKLTNDEAITCRDDLRTVLAPCPAQDWLNCYETAAEGCPDNLCTEPHRKKFALPIYANAVRSQDAACADTGKICAQVSFNYNKLAECVPISRGFCKDVITQTCIRDNFSSDNEYKLEAFTDGNQTLQSICLKLSTAKTCFEKTMNGKVDYFGSPQTNVCADRQIEVEAILALVNPIYTQFCGEGVTAKAVCLNGGDLTDLSDEHTKSNGDQRVNLPPRANSESIGGDGDSGVSTPQALISMVSLSLITIFVN